MRWYDHTINCSALGLDVPNFESWHHNNFAPFAMDKDDIQYCIDAADEAYKVVAANHPEANFIK